MAAAVLIPLSAINQNGGILPASALIQHAPRHGRSRGMSLKGKSAKGRAYSVVDDADVSTAKAISFLLKRAVKEDEVESGDEENTYVVSDAEGWVTVSDLLLHSNLVELRIDLEGVQSAAASPRARFSLRQKPDSDAERAESYQVRQNAKRDSLQLPALEGVPLTSESESLPEYVVYETTYQAYPRILAFGGIKRAEGAAYSSFSPVTTAAEEGEPAAARHSDADVGIWVHLGTAMEQAPGITWQLTPSGSIATSAEVPKHLWKKVVGRRQDVGLLFEDGQVHNEVPAYLRGKGGKGKAKRGKGHLRMASESDSNNSEEM